jgi:hypothetical protein
MNKTTAIVCLEADEYRCIWYVLIKDHENVILHRRPFCLMQDAEMFANRYNLYYS